MLPTRVGIKREVVIDGILAIGKPVRYLMSASVYTALPMPLMSCHTVWYKP